MSTAAARIRPRETRGDRTRARLVEAALAEFRGHGFERASIARIAADAGVSRPTFYFHFATKEDLLREVLFGMQLAVAERVQRAAGLREALAELTEGILEQRAEVGAGVFAEMLRAQTRVAAAAKSDDEPRPVWDALDRHFAEGFDRRELRAGLEPSFATRLYLSSVFGCLLDADEAGDPEHPERLRVLSSLFLNDRPSNPNGRDPNANPSAPTETAS